MNKNILVEIEGWKNITIEKENSNSTANQKK